MNPIVNISRIATLNPSRLCVAGALTVIILSACAAPGAETQVGPAANATTAVQEDRTVPAPVLGGNPNEHLAHRNVDPQAQSTTDLGGNPNEHLAHRNH